MGIPAHARKWTYNNDASAALTNEEAFAAITGRMVFVTHILYSTALGGTFKLLDASSGTVKFGTITLGVTGGFIADREDNPIEMGHSKGVFVTTTGGGVACVSLAGYSL